MRYRLVDTVRGRMVCRSMRRDLLERRAERLNRNDPSAGRYAAGVTRYMVIDPLSPKPSLPYLVI